MVALVCVQRPPAGHVGAPLAVVHVGEVPERPPDQEDEGQLPGGAPASGLGTTAQREVPDLPQHCQVHTHTHTQEYDPSQRRPSPLACFLLDAVCIPVTNRDHL